VEVAALADTTVVLQAPDTGDEVQAIKAGLLEVADLVVVGKADRPGADRAASQLRAMLTVGVSDDRSLGDRPRPKRPLILLASGTTGEGVADLLAAIDRHGEGRTADGSVTPARIARAEAQVLGILVDQTRQRLRSADAHAVVRAVASRQLDPFAAADRLLGVG
jgi:LAO/AO transport system kinase